MFNSATIYTYTPPAKPLTADSLEAELAPLAFVECGASQARSSGFLPVRGEKNGPLVESIGGQLMLKMMVETKAVPGDAVKRKVKERADAHQEATGRKPGRKELRDMKEDVALSLLPLVLSKQASVYIWLNPKTNTLLVATFSQALIDEALTLLIKAVDGLVIAPLNTQTSPGTAMTHWLAEQDAPEMFSVDRECELRSNNESKGKVRYTNVALDTEEVVEQIKQGNIPVFLALTWNERISFILTDSLQLKKVTFLEAVFKDRQTDQAADNFDTDVAIATGEFIQMLPDLINALGGELKTLPEPERLAA